MAFNHFRVEYLNTQNTQMPTALYLQHKLVLIQDVSKSYTKLFTKMLMKLKIPQNMWHLYASMGSLGVFLVSLSSNHSESTKYEFSRAVF
jgi:hypothetical protein